MSLVEITLQRRYRYPIFAIIIGSALSTLVGFVLLMTICRPIEKTWLGEMTDGSCTNAQLYSTFSYIVSIVTVITDWGCAIIPAFVIWGLNMRRSLKISAYILVVFGSIASISTIVRLPYLVEYTATTDGLYHKANIVIWSMVEMGIGIIAGSMPSLSKLLFRCLAISSQPRQIQPQHRIKRYHWKQRVGQLTSGSRNLGSFMTDQDVALGSWTELTDADSQKHVNRAFDQEPEQGLDAARKDVTPAGEAI